MAISRKRLLWILVPAALITVALLFYFISYAPLPKGKTGDKAEILAAKMLKATGYQAWKRTAAVSFDFVFAGKTVHSIFWDKNRHFVEIRWKKNRVQFHQHTKKGIAWVDNTAVTDSHTRNALIEEANKAFVNDVYWLNPVFHLRSVGAKRYLVSDNQLAITFHSGGNTPGDTYLFDVDEQGLVTKMTLWASILPVKGISATFSGYITTKTNVKLATNHRVLFVLNIEIKNAKMYKTYPAKADRFNKLTDLR